MFPDNHHVNLLTGQTKTTARGIALRVFTDGSTRFHVQEMKGCWEGIRFRSSSHSKSHYLFLIYVFELLD